MKATIESTWRLVEISDPKGRRCDARVWEGVTESGIPFVAYITQVQVKADENRTEFDRDLDASKAPSEETLRAIPLRYIL